MNEVNITPRCAANRLKEFNKKNKFSGKDMAKMGGITEQAFSGYLQAKNLPAANVLAEWAKKPGMNINWFLTGEGEMLRIQDSEPARSQDIQIALANALQEITALSRENRILREQQASGHPHVPTPQTENAPTGDIAQLLDPSSE
jgi:transcriptional regulator with XRE-family HTH domain